MKKFINGVGVILISLDIIYTIMIEFFDWTVKKEIVLPTIILTGIYAFYRLYFYKDKEDA